MKATLSILGLFALMVIGCKGPQKPAENTVVETTVKAAVDSVSVQLDSTKAEIDQSVKELDKLVKDLN